MDVFENWNGFNPEAAAQKKRRGGCRSTLWPRQLSLWAASREVLISSCG
jgi:hypothetical protein